jgi:uncharacterized membrane protein
MATLTVWKFPTANGAVQAERTLADLQARALIRVHDAASVSWAEGKKRPKTRQLHDLVGAGALSGGFWGMLLGIIFLTPLLGFVVGAAAGALSGSLRDVGINDDFIADVRKRVTPGTSALFVLSSDAVLDKVREAFAGQDMELIETNLTSEQEAKLHEVFDEEP